MNTPIYQVDSFTNQAFQGNPAGVVVLQEVKTNSWMVSVAAEMNLSETAFLIQKGEKYHLRWFTPKVEVELCGHATLASAHILWEQGFLEKGEPAVFETLSEELSAKKVDNWIEMDFPGFSSKKVKLNQSILDSLGGSPLQALEIGENLMLEYSDPEEISDLNPDMLQVGELPYQGVIVTSRSDGQPYDFVSRYFAPQVGINEDPVTGSAHSCLAPFWSARLGKDELTAYQASARGGEIRMRIAGDRVRIRGQAKTIFSGELLV